MSFDPKKYIKISNLEEAEKARSKLIKLIWKQKDIPDTQPSKSTNKSWQATCLRNMNSLREVNQFKFKMPHGVTSVFHLYTPKNNTKKGAVIYHHGHGSREGDTGEHVINFFLSKGYHVVGLFMPLAWPNSKPDISGVQYGNDVEGHNLLQNIETKDFCPLRFFIEPVSVCLNLLEKKYDFDFYHMVGLSGGGVTTMMCSAIDTRISHGYNVAGGIPIKLRTSSRDQGDYEQVHKKFYSIASYLDLYILGSIGEGRKCVQVYNRFDACCFSSNPHKHWEKEVKEVVKKMDGYYNVYSDSSHRGHIISNWALKKIIKEMEAS